LSCARILRRSFLNNSFHKHPHTSFGYVQFSIPSDSTSLPCVSFFGVFPFCFLGLCFFPLFSNLSQTFPLFFEPITPFRGSRYIFFAPGLGYIFGMSRMFSSTFSFFFPHFPLCSRDGSWLCTISLGWYKISTAVELFLKAPSITQFGAKLRKPFSGPPLDPKATPCLLKDPLFFQGHRCETKFTHPLFHLRRVNPKLLLIRFFFFLFSPPAYPPLTDRRTV